MNQIVTVILDFKLGSLKLNSNGDRFLVKWADGKYREVTTSMFAFSVESMAEALSHVAILNALNPGIKSIKLSVQ